MRWKDKRTARRKENARRKRSSMLETEKKRKLLSRTKRDKMDIDVVGVLFWYFSLAFGSKISFNKYLNG